MHRPLALFALLTLTPAVASAHGLHGHVHVTGWAIENLPDGDLRDFFRDPEVFQAALMGATFPDSGYAANDPNARAYGEHAHWEPFIEPFIQHVRATYGPTYTKEERLVVAFLLGCASHGLQDELFDSTFMYEAEQRDGYSQGELDPGTDGFLVQDGYFRHLPGPFVPFDDILPLFAEQLPDAVVTRELIEFQLLLVTAAYVNDGPGLNIARDHGEEYRPLLPWASTHYMRTEVAGSLRAEIIATGRHMEALWDRLHDRFDEQDLVVHTWPDAPRRVREADHTSVASWVTFVLGKGIDPNTATATLTDGSGNPHPFDLRFTRWGGTSRIVRFQPTADFVPGATYTATLEAGATLVDGSTTTQSISETFQVECATPDDPACPPLMDLVEPTTDTPLPPPSSGCAAAYGHTPDDALGVVIVALALACSRKLRRRT